MESSYVTLSNKLIAVFNAINSAYNNSKNNITSPISLYACFALLAEGTRGKSFSELQSAFGYGNHPAVLNQEMMEYVQNLQAGKSKSVMIRMDNSIYSSVSVKNQYKNDIKTKYLALAKKVDFSNPNTIIEINNRIKECTNGLLKNTITAIDPLTIMVLVNTIYFKGDWKEKFEKSNTVKGVFKMANREKAVDFMCHSKLKCGYLEAGDLKYLSIPYSGGKCVFVVEMRKDGSILDSDYKNVLKVANLNEKECVVRIPRFKAKFKENINKVIKSMGINSIYHTSNDFQNISNGEVLVSQVIHNAFIQVDESGTEAAGATVVFLSKGCSTGKPPSRPVFTADRPFHYHIVDTSNDIILFSGTIHEPKFRV